MAFLLITAGYETTYNLITNAVVTLLDHPDQLARLHQQAGILPAARSDVENDKRRDHRPRCAGAAAAR